MRSSLQLGVVSVAIFLLVILIDSRFRVLPQTIHQHLPAHHEGLVVTDITVKTCSALNPFASCKLDPEEWNRVEKDLYLNTGWVSQAYIHVKRKKEEELEPHEKIIVNIKCGRLDPAMGEKDKGDEKWESRPAGMWILRSAKRHSSDSNEAVVAVDVLFGADAVEPRIGWKIRETPLLLDAGADIPEVHLTIRTGRLHKIDRPILRIRKDGKFKILQLADLHLSTGLGHCRDPMPAGQPCEADPRTLGFVHRILDDEEPDLVVLSGDQVNGETSPDVQSVCPWLSYGKPKIPRLSLTNSAQTIFKIVELLVKRHNPIPYAAIFGNHDDESTLSRTAQMALLETLPYSLSESGPATVDGIGNYVVEVLAASPSSHSALSLYLLDTHSYSPDEQHFKGYDWIKESQNRWFKETAQANKRRHKEYTRIHMDMAFLHIPLPEYRDKGNVVVGEWREPPTAPGFNSGFKDALVEEGIHVVSCGQ